MKRILCLIAAAFAIFNHALGRLRSFPLARIHYFAPGGLSMPFKPVSTLTVIVALFLHFPIYGSSLQPKGSVVGGGSSGGGPGCAWVVVDTLVLGPALVKTVLGSPGMCLSPAEFPGLGEDERIGDVGVFCAPDAAASPCSGAAVALGNGGGSLSNLQFRVDLAATITGAAAGGITSGTLRVCGVASDVTCLTPLPFQALNNGVISISLGLTLPAVIAIGAEIDIDSIPAGATLNINNFVLKSVPNTSAMGAIQVCKTRGVGIVPGTPFNFNLEEFTVTAPPVRQVITVPAGVGTESCSDDLLFPKGSLVVIHELASGSEVVDIVGGTVDILRGTAATLVGDNPIKFTFTNKMLGTEGCGSGYYIHHPDSFPRVVSALASQLTSDSTTIFGSPLLTDMSFLQALEEQGGRGVQGAADLLSRSAVTALLNATHPDVAYALTMSDVFQLASDAFASNDRATILAVSEKFDAANNGAGGCPLH